MLWNLFTFSMSVPRADSDKSSPRSPVIFPNRASSKAAFEDFLRERFDTPQPSPQPPSRAPLDQHRHTQVFLLPIAQAPNSHTESSHRFRYLMACRPSLIREAAGSLRNWPLPSTIPGVRLCLAHRAPTWTHSVFFRPEAFEWNRVIQFAVRSFSPPEVRSSRAPTIPSTLLNAGYAAHLFQRSSRRTSAEPNHRVRQSRVASRAQRLNRLASCAGTLPTLARHFEGPAKKNVRYQGPDSPLAQGLLEPLLSPE